MAFSEYPVLGLAQARDHHLTARKILVSGVDPMAQRKAEAEAKQREVEAQEREAENSFEKVARKGGTGRHPASLSAILVDTKELPDLLLLMESYDADAHGTQPGGQSRRHETNGCRPLWRTLFSMLILLSAHFFPEPTICESARALTRVRGEPILNVIPSLRWRNELYSPRCYICLWKS